MTTSWRAPGFRLYDGFVKLDIGPCRHSPRRRVWQMPVYKQPSDSYEVLSYYGLYELHGAARGLMTKYYLARRRDDHEPLFIIKMLPEHLEPTFKTLDEYRDNFQGFVFQELKDSEAETYIEFGSLPVSHVWHILTDLADNDGIFDNT